MIGKYFRCLIGPSFAPVHMPRPNVKMHVNVVILPLQSRKDNGARQPTTLANNSSLSCKRGTRLVSRALAGVSAAAHVQVKIQYACSSNPDNSHP